MTREEELKILKEKLKSFSGKDFDIFLTTKILNLSAEQIQTAQFAFWFCYEVEHTLDRLLKYAWGHMESMNGKTPEGQIDFIKNKYGINLVHIIPEHPMHDPEKITFSHRVGIIEKINGKSSYIKFLRKINGIRNDVSHCRIENLRYEGADLSLNTTKAKLLYDYMEQCMNFIEMESVGGVVGGISPEEKKQFYDEFNKRKQKNEN